MKPEIEISPVIAITMGDAAGIGPEIVLKALAQKDVVSGSRCVVIGDKAVLERTSEALGLGFRFREFGTAGGRDGIEVADMNNLPAAYDVGVDAAVTGRASAEYIAEAVRLWRDGKINAVCTAPISKKAIHMGGYDYPGHTEFLAELTGTERFAMSFFADKLRVVLLSTHVSLTDAIGLVTKDALVERIQFANETLSKLLARKVSIAVAGLNPHASEGGMFGSEEHQTIKPAVDHCRDHLGIDVSGPYAPDTIFLRGYKGEFDAVIALYHDQATIAVKSLSFGSGVNVTLGLPLVRTSVDHGTAYDIAGKGGLMRRAWLLPSAWPASSLRLADKAPSLVKSHRGPS